VFYFSAAPLMKTLAESGPVVAEADSGAARFCAGFYFGGAAQVIAPFELGESTEVHASVAVTAT
jgi:hypothetical protein